MKRFLYVPVLRWKLGERGALAALAISDKAKVIPIIEPTSAAFPDEGKHSAGSVITSMITFASQVGDAWQDNPAFVDFHLIPPHIEGVSGPHSLETFFIHSVKKGLRITPVIGLDHRSRLQSAAIRVARSAKSGLAIRLRPCHTARPSWFGQILEILEAANVPVEKAHLIIDRTVVVDGAMSVDAILPRIPNLGSWRSVTVIGGSFPKDLSELKGTGQFLLPRTEWRSWLRFLNGASCDFKPAFGDYTTQHALFGEPPKPSNFSASIRYTTADSWLVMKGESVFKPGAAGYDQWPANAMLLCEREEFSGASFSEGDAFISAKANDGSRPGTASLWLEATVNHHMTFVIRQLEAIAA